jgi:para-nitrobenzyl esterase
VAVFRGVPFAAPPVGAHRFAAPAPAARWDGVRDASRFGPPPPRPGKATDGDDWLTLAVWTPDPGRADLPVLVWISGGGYLACDSADPYLDGATLAAAGAVVVSPHYRSGAEGFLHLEGAPDNRALLDQVAALAWVHDNAAAFGGDPGAVTAFGQSAGAGSIAALLAAPAAIGAVRRAILQSIPGTYLSPALAAGVAAEICAGIGRTPHVDDLSGIHPDVLAAAALAVRDGLPQRRDHLGALAHSSTPFAPVVDGHVLPAAPWAALAAGAARGVDLLIGHTRDEYSLLAAGLPATDDAGVDALLAELTPTPGARRYRKAFPELTADALRETALADWLYRMPALHLADAADRGGARTWLSELRWGFGPHGASHGLDTLLVFGTTDVAGEVTAAGPAVLADCGRLSALIRAAHLAFASTGDPGWDRYDRHRRPTRVYDPEPDLVPYPEERSRAIWQDRRFGVLDLRGWEDGTFGSCRPRRATWTLRGNRRCVVTKAGELRELHRADCLRLLVRGSIGRVVFTEGALPAAHPVTYLLDGEEIVFRTADGGKLAAATLRRVVAFQVDEIDVEATSGWSVLGVGEAYEVTDPRRLADLAERMPAPRVRNRDGRIVAIPLQRLTGRRLSA